jgi:hypothetical protein
MKLDHPEVALELPPGVRKDARAAWVVAAPKVTESNLQRDVQRVFKSLGVHPVVEHATEYGFFSIDLALPGTKERNRTLIRDGHLRLV